MSARPVLGREDVLAVLAQRDGRAAGDRGEQVDSLDLAWLLHAVEERHGVELDPTDGELERMSTVSGAAEVLAELLGRDGARG